MAHGVDGEDDEAGQESLGPSPDQTDLAKTYLLVFTVDPEGYAARVLGLSAGDKIYGMTVPSKDGIASAVKDTRVSGNDILQRIKDSCEAGKQDKEAKKLQTAATRKEKKTLVSITDFI